MLVVIDEAHNICAAEPDNAVSRITTERAIQIAAEGRKYGLYLLVSTQRPNKVHENVVSQCDNLLLMRMNSMADVGDLTRLFSFVPPGLMAGAPSFGLGQALVARPALPAGRRLRADGRPSLAGGWSRHSDHLGPGADVVVDNLLAVVGVVLVITDYVIKFLAIGVLPNNRKPSSAMAWLILILIVPFAGFVIFLFLGRTNLGKGRLRRQREADEAIRAATDLLPTERRRRSGVPGLDGGPQPQPRLPAAPDRQPRRPDHRLPRRDRRDDGRGGDRHGDRRGGVLHRRLGRRDGAVLRSPGGRRRSRREGAAAVRPHGLAQHPGVRRVREAARRLGHRLATRCSRSGPLKGQFQRPDLRNHRKLLVVDGRVGFMGSQNLIEPGYNKASNHKGGREYVELVARIDGPAVTALRAVFAKDWYTETHERMGEEFARATPAHHDDGVAAQVLPSGPGYVTENNLRLFTALIYSAQTRISVTSPYFVPDEPLLYALTTAARRGVAVELFVSEEGDQFMVFHAQCSYYQALLESGIRIYQYPSPAVLHSKYFSVDDDVAVIGSSNMDMRSFALNHEVSMMLTGGDIVARFRKVEDAYRALSRELTIEEWRQRSMVQRYLDNTMRLTAALQ